MPRKGVGMPPCRNFAAEEVVDMNLHSGWNTVLARVIKHRGDFTFKMSIAAGEELKFAAEIPSSAMP